MTALDEAQSAVVRHRSGPALVIAGAGAGKTRTIVARVVDLLHRDVDPREILCLTFTNKAAAEMRTRIGHEAGARAKRLTIRTFHSTCLDLLRFRPPPDRERQFTLWDDTTQVREMRSLVRTHRNADAVPRGDWVEVGDLVDLHDGTREMGAPLFDAAYHARAATIHPDALEVLEEYERMKRVCNAVDFADLVWDVAVRLLDPRHPACAALQARWSHVIVDEYQDCNAVQELLLDRLTGPIVGAEGPPRPRNLMAVGDEDQAIYAFRGSDVRWIRGFSRRYADASVYTLGRNYRSERLVVEAANALISQNRHRTYKRVWSEAGTGAMQLAAFGTPMEEAEAIAEAIDQARAAGTGLDRLAVLVRKRHQFVPIEIALTRRSIPYTVVGATPWWARVDVRLLLAWFRATVNSRDLDAGAQVLAGWSGIGATTVTRWRALAERSASAMFDAIGALHAEPGLGVHTKRGAALDAFQTAWRAWDHASIHTTESLRLQVEGLLDRLGVLAEIAEGKSSPRNEESAEATRREVFLNQILETFPDDRPGHWEEMKAWMDDLYTRGGPTESPASASGPVLVLSTIHGAKGLEWDAVVLPGWSSGVFPSAQAIDARAIEEERRLAYVAVTRARSQIYLSWYAYSAIPTPQDHQRSIFLDEMDPKGAKGPAWTLPDEAAGSGSGPVSREG